MSIRSDNRHLYLRVIDRMKEDVAKGVYVEGQRLPSESTLSKSLGVSRATLREALRVLEEERIVVKKHGIGTFIHHQPDTTPGIEQLQSITSYIEKSGKEPGTIMLSEEIQLATDEEKSKFHNMSLQQIHCIERIRTANTIPVCYSIDKIPIEYMPSYSKTEESLLKFICKKTNRPILYTETEVEPINYHEYISPLLKCEKELALLLVKQLHYDQDNQPVLYSLSYFRPDKIQFKVVRKSNI